VVLATDHPEAEARFREIPDVENVTLRDGHLAIRGRGDGLVTHVIQCLAEYRIRVSDFRTIQPTLEDVFLRLTGHSIRD
jgi:ABC-2 type transport system ATP-binding protein